MIKLSIAAAAGTLALFAFAATHAASASESDFKGYTKMPAASQPHAYTPAPPAPGPATYSPYTKMPSGSVTQVSTPQSNQPQPQRK
jgi:hypothetical protein